MDKDMFRHESVGLVRCMCVQYLFPIPLSTHGCLINGPERWSFSRSIPMPLHQLSIQYSHTSDKGVETRRGLDCSFHLIPTLFQDKFLLSLVFAVFVLYLVWGKSEMHCHLISFASVARVSGFFWMFWRGQTTCGHRRVCQQMTFQGGSPTFTLCAYLWMQIQR